MIKQKNFLGLTLFVFVSLPAEQVAEATRPFTSLGNAHLSTFTKKIEVKKDINNFANYQVRVIRHDNGSFSYPFKLEEGAADQNVAIDILKKQGFDASILDDANDLLNE